MLSAPMFFTPPRSKWRILEFCQIVCLGLLQPLDQSAQTNAVLQPSAIAIFIDWHIRATGSSNEFACFFIADKSSKFIAQILKLFHLRFEFRHFFRCPCKFFCAPCDQFLQVRLKYFIRQIDLLFLAGWVYLSLLRAKIASYYLKSGNTVECNNCKALINKSFVVEAMFKQSERGLDYDFRHAQLRGGLPCFDVFTAYPFEHIFQVRKRGKKIVVVLLSLSY